MEYGDSFKAKHLKGLSLRAFFWISLFILSSMAVAIEVGFSANYLTPVTAPQLSNNSTSQGLIVDVYTDNAARGANVSIGTYTVGDQIKFYVSLSQNCSIKLEFITPDGSIWIREVAPVSAGTFVDYFEAQYPIGLWRIVVVAQQGSSTVTETAPFEVVDKALYTSTRTVSPNASIIEETRFDGRVVQVYLYPRGGVYGWNISITRVYQGPESNNITVSVGVVTYNEAVNVLPTLRPGYVDPNITLGDQVQVYGLLSQNMGKLSVTLNGSMNYYIKKASTLFNSPEIILFTREVFPENLTVRISGIAIPGTQDAKITTVNWSWGDGQTSEQQFPATHTYDNVGTYVIQINATQNDGLSTIKSLSVTVPPNVLSETATQTTVAKASDSTFALAAVIATIAVVLVVTIRFRSKKAKPATA
jgi:hypothetical protein